MNGQNRKDIHPGLPVAIILKKRLALRKAYVNRWGRDCKIAS
ncbi:MAG TPA: hypothetical protein VJ161_11300 [Geobacteraceae bacterium]|nr:hypothetical protein [Geobacteraceae bacterium]